jgi:hypothetical protein
MLLLTTWRASQYYEQAIDDLITVVFCEQRPLTLSYTTVRFGRVSFAQ